MALGGYKFKGYYYRVPSDYDSSDESQVKAQCLQMFKCRLRAFMDSCSLSGAQWEFSYTNGDIQFGSYGNVIYTLDSYGYNHGAFFKYRDKEQYMMLLDYQNGSATFANSFCYGANSGSPHYYYDISRTRSACGLIPFTPSDCMSLLNKRLMLRSVNGSTDYNPNAIQPSIVSMRFGFATKGCDIIEVIRYGTSSTFMFKIMSPDGFSSLCSPNDVSPVFDYVDGGKSTWSNSPKDYHYHLNSRPIQILRDDGSIVVNFDADNYLGNRGAYLSIFPQPESFFAYPVDRIPYAAPLITSYSYNVGDSSSVINQDGIRSKGYVKPELMSINTPFPYTAMSGLNLYKPYAGGNYLLFSIFFIASSANMPVSMMSYYNGAVYCGWDPSNPDITQSTAWEDYVHEP